MKKINQICTLAGVCLSLLSCSEFLTENPYSSISSENFYKTSDDAFAGLNAVYASFRGYYGYDVYYQGDISADLATNGEVSGGINELDINSTQFQGTWGQLYSTINYANTVLANVPSINMDENLKNRYLAEAKFLRAMTYFILVQSFGDVPLITVPTTNEENNYLSRTDQNAVYSFIIQDMLETIDFLPMSYSSNDIGRVSKGAAQSLLAKVYLTHKDYQQARDLAKAVMQSGTYALCSNLKDVFDIAKENGKEHIFSIQFDSDTKVVSSYTSSFASRNPIIILGGIGQQAGSAVAAERNFYENYPEHYRKQVILLDSIPDPFWPKIIPANGSGKGKLLAGPCCMKYYDSNLKAISQGDANWMVIRYAEVLLIFAEAENEVNGPTDDAYKAANDVRKRARDSNGDGIDDPSDAAKLPDLSGLSKDDFRKAVWRERELELCFEGHQRWDLLRQGRFMEAMTANGKNPQEKHLLFPIPLLEIQANPNLTQNPGY
jgi:hypothetical protein